MKGKLVATRLCAVFVGLVNGRRTLLPLKSSTLYALRGDGADVQALRRAAC